VINCAECKSHRRFNGGILDGLVQHYSYDVIDPPTLGTELKEGQRSWYVHDQEASSDTDAVYQCMGLGREMPKRCTS
jgi:hypothetical protein